MRDESGKRKDGKAEVKSKKAKIVTDGRLLES